MIVLGIDPGLSGAVAVLYGDGRAPGVWPTPTLTVEKGKRRARAYDLQAMCDLLREEVPFPGPATVLCALEAAQAFPGQGVVSMFTCGFGAGAWEGLLVSFGIPYHRVHPATWKRIMFRDSAAKKGKGAAILMAKRLFPGVGLRASPASRKDSDGMAESLLLAEYGRRLQRGVIG